MHPTGELCRVRRWTVAQQEDFYTCEMLFVDDGDLRVQLLTPKGVAVIEERRDTPHGACVCAEELLVRFLRRGWSLVANEHAAHDGEQPMDVH